MLCKILNYKRILICFYLSVLFSQYPFLILSLLNNKYIFNKEENKTLIKKNYLKRISLVRIK